MKNINITNIVDPTSLQPFTGNSLKFLQDAQAERAAGIIKTIITQNKGSYSLAIPYVISGCVVSDSDKDVTAGEIFYGGEFFQTTAINGTTNVAQFVLTKTQDVTADPLTFSDGQIWSVHDIFKYVGTDTATPGTFASTDLVSAYGASKSISQTNLATLTTSSTGYVDVTGCTYTNSSGSSKTLMIVGKCYCVPISNFGVLQIWNGTTELDVSTGGDLLNSNPERHSVSVNYVGVVANGVTVNLRAKCDQSISMDFKNFSLSIIEI